MSKTAFLGPNFFFSSWQFSYLLFLVPEKVQSGSWQNKKLRTLATAATAATAGPATAAATARAG